MPARRIDRRIRYVRVGRAFRRMARDGAVDAAKERLIQLRLRLYLLVFVLVWAVPLAHRLLELGGVDTEWLQVVHLSLLSRRYPILH